MIIQQLDQRILGAVRFRDVVSGLVINEPLRIEATDAGFLRNGRACYAIVTAPGLEHHTRSFLAPPAAPLSGSRTLELTIRDDTGRYLARRATVRLPRDPDPTRATQPQSLFMPMDVRMFPSTTGFTSLGWAVVRGTVQNAQRTSPAPHALIRVLRDRDNAVVGRGLADARGEALIAVQGIPITTFGEADGPVLASEEAVQLEVIWDPALQTLPDPDELEQRRAALLLRTTPARLASGRVIVLSL